MTWREKKWGPPVIEREEKVEAVTWTDTWDLRATSAKPPLKPLATVLRG